jgi:antitoxin (DNA-binding transcriptional repressor) of toxin-antitoxin stability system
MRFVSVRDLRGKSSEIWRELADERELVVTNNGRPIAILATVNEGNLEGALAAFRRQRAIDAVAKLQGQSVCQGTSVLTPIEIEQEIQVVRRFYRAK